MPIVFVYGIPDEFAEGKVEKDLFPALLKAVTDVKELGLQGDQVTIFFPLDKMEKGLGEEIIIFVEGIFEKPERTEDVRKHLAQNLGRAAKSHFPKAMVECFIRPFNPKQGFWSSAENS